MRTDVPQASDAFYIDTNVWYWMAYPRARQRTMPPRGYQLRAYPRFVNAALSLGARLHHLGLNLGELAHVIEGAELDIFQQTNVIRHRKAFRHDHPVERARVVTELADAWREIERISSFVEVLVDQRLINDTLRRLRTELLDGYDALVVERLAQVGIDQVITDDADFATVTGITMFTANLTVLNAAQTQGRLIIRDE